MNKIIEQVYETNFYPGFEKLMKLTKTIEPTVKRSDIKSFLDKQESAQQTTMKKERKQSGHITALIKNEVWQMDTFILDRYAKQNKGFKYLLVCVDVFTRKAFAEPMKNKDGPSVSEAFQKIVKRAGDTPRSIMSDNDKAYLSDTFLNLMDKLKIALQPNVLNDHRALGIIDNFARRLKTTITKLQLHKNNLNWVDSIQNIIDNYNKSDHQAIDDLTPNEASEPKNNDNIHEINLIKSFVNRQVSDLKHDDSVRISIKKTFTKGTDPGYSADVYKVVSVRGGNVTLDDGKTYKRDNLLKVDSNTNNSSIIQTAKKEKKIDQVLKRDDIDKINIVEGKRRNYTFV